MKKMLSVLILVLLTGFQARQVTAKTNAWRFEVMPTIWATGVDIDSTTVKGRSVSAEIGFEDIFENINFGGAVQFEAWKGNWGILISNLYLDLDLGTDYTPPIGPAVGADIGIRFNLLEAAIAHRFDVRSERDVRKNPLGERQHALSIEPIGGFRYGVLKQRIALKISPALLPGIGETARTTEGDAWWLEIFAGGRLNYSVRRNWTIQLRGDIGGIKFGDETVFSWNVFAGLDYKPWKSTSVNLGYKIYDFNYEDNSDGDKFKLDAMLHGPSILLILRY